jgi:hypothetical protein
LVTSKFTTKPSSALVEVRCLSTSVASSTLLTGGKNYPKARFTAHQAGVRVCGIF